MTLVSEELRRHEASAQGRFSAIDSMHAYLARPAMEVSTSLRSTTSFGTGLRPVRTPPPSTPEAGVCGSPFTPGYEVDKLDVAERLAAAVAQRLRKSHSPRTSLGGRTPTPPRSATTHPAEEQVRDLAAKLATENAVATSRQEEAHARLQEAQAYREERDAAQAQLQEALERRSLEEEQREFLHWQAGCAELPVLRAQLQTTELEECAASERSAQVETWLHGAAGEAREALALARQMAAAEATCLAQIAASDAARDHARDEMRQMRTQLLNVESANGSLQLYNEEAEVAMKWRRRAQDIEARVQDFEARAEARLQDFEARAEARSQDFEARAQDREDRAQDRIARAQDREAKGEARIEELENRLRSVESRQAKVRALYQATQAGQATHDAESENARLALREEYNVSNFRRM